MDGRAAHVVPMAVEEQQEEFSEEDIQSTLEFLYPHEAAKNFYCPITHSLLVDPVLTVDGHQYDRTQILEWFKNCRDNDRPITSPLTNETLASEELIPNVGLRKLLADLRANILPKVCKLLKDSKAAHTKNAELEARLANVLNKPNEEKKEDAPSQNFALPLGLAAGFAFAAGFFNRQQHVRVNKAVEEFIRAVRHRRLDIVTNFLERREYCVNDPHPVDGETGLIAAIRSFCEKPEDEIRKKILELICEYRYQADPNLTDNEGNTALHYAAQANNEFALKLLFNKQANPKVFNKHNKNATCLFLQNKRCDRAIIELFDRASDKHEYVFFNEKPARVLR